VLAQTKPPQYVIYHELIHTAKAFMRHALGVERSWLLKCRERVGKASLPLLTGGHLDHSVLMPEDGGEEEEEKDGEKSSGKKKKEVVVEEKASEEVVSEARRRFLERKQAKASAPGKKR